MFAFLESLGLLPSSDIPIFHVSIHPSMQKLKPTCPRPDDGNGMTYSVKRVDSLNPYKDGDKWFIYRNIRNSENAEFVLVFDMDELSQLHAQDRLYSRDMIIINTNTSLRHLVEPFYHGRYQTGFPFGNN